MSNTVSSQGIALQLTSTLKPKRLGIGTQKNMHLRTMQSLKAMQKEKFGE